MRGCQDDVNFTLKPLFTGKHLRKPANKGFQKLNAPCIEGVPGFCFILTKLEVLKQTERYARSLSLDLLGQYVGFEKNGQFRFTPPTHVVVSFQEALIELEHEGDVEARLARYRKNYERLSPGFFLKRELT